MPQPNLIKLDTYIMAPEPISTAYFSLPIAARQRLGKNVTAATNSHATIEELLDASIYMPFVTDVSKESGRKVVHRTSCSNLK
jgi:hypothetical protein